MSYQLRFEVLSVIFGQEAASPKTGHVRHCLRLCYIHWWYLNGRPACSPCARGLGPVLRRLGPPFEVSIIVDFKRRSARLTPRSDGARNRPR